MTSTDRVQFRLVQHPEGQAPLLPLRQTDHAACMDVFAYLPKGRAVTVYNDTNDKRVETVQAFNGIVLYPGERALIPTGWAVKCPAETSMRIYSRSGLALKEGLILPHSVGIIDADYRDEVFVTLMNTSKEGALIRHEQRIAQAEIVIGWTPQVIVTTTDDIHWFDTNRKGGFGSTGQ